MSNEVRRSGREKKQRVILDPSVEEEQHLRRPAVTSPVVKNESGQLDVVHTDDNLHLALGIRTGTGFGADDGDNVNVDNEDDTWGVVEYDVGGETHVRASALAGPLASAAPPPIKHNENNEDEELELDDDDDVYGPSQYHENDLVAVEDDDKKRRKRHRLGSTTSSKSHGKKLTDEEKANRLSQKYLDAVIRLVQAGALDAACSLVINPPIFPDDYIPDSSDEVTVGKRSKVLVSFQRLRDRLKSLNQDVDDAKDKCEELEQTIEEMGVIREQGRCRVCLEPFKEPCVSVQCWHLHCKECWMKVLGTKRLCPQYVRQDCVVTIRCNSITGPKDLRRIYL